MKCECCDLPGVNFDSENVWLCAEHCREMGWPVPDRLEPAPPEVVPALESARAALLAAPDLPPGAALAAAAEREWADSAPRCPACGSAEHYMPGHPVFDTDPRCDFAGCEAPITGYDEVGQWCDAHPFERCAACGRVLQEHDGPCLHFGRASA